MRHTNQQIDKNKRSGTALILAALSCLAIIPILGLAIDGAHVYMMDNQLSTALNAAVLAGTRSLNVGQDIASQAANATSIADMVFNANVSSMGTQMSTPALVASCPPSANTVCFSVTEDDHTRKITGSVQASLPLMLMGMIGLNATTVNFTTSAQRRDVNVVLVLDHSGGMQGTPLSTMQTDATNFVNMFANGRDNIGLVTYTDSPFVAEALPNRNFLSNVPNDIASLTSPGNSYTNTSAALWAAYLQLQHLNQIGALNVIVLFTDGLPGAFTGNFAGLSTVGSVCSLLANPLYGVLYSDQYQTTPGGLTDYIATSINDTPDIRPAPGCSAIGSYPGAFLSLMPPMDINGNATNGTGVRGVFGPYIAADLTSLDQYNITYASENALDYAANRIRSDTNLSPVIFAIGLGGNSWTPPDPVLMPRVANDPTSPSYNSSQPAGHYIGAPTTAQLQSAFTVIASQVLQLAR